MNKGDFIPSAEWIKDNLNPALCLANCQLETGKFTFLQKI